MKITAHRGNSYYTPENTITAIKSAIEVGADWAEIDVQETMDGELVVFHDSNLKRVTGVDKNIWEISYIELNKLDAGNWFSPQFLGEKIPKLRDLMAVSRGKIKLNLELKLNGHQQSLASRVVRLIQELNFVEHCAITSFDLATIKEVKVLNENIRRGIIVQTLESELLRLPVDIYAVHYSAISHEFIQKAHFQGKEVHVWTVDTQEDMQKMIRLGVDNIMTNRPKLLKLIIAHC